jgi:hypothetical protein
MTLRGNRCSLALWLLVAFCMLAALWLTGCAPRVENPSVYWEQTPRQAQIAADLHAKDKGGKAYHVMPTGSMEPFITGGDYVVVLPAKEIIIGRIYLYTASWTVLPALHRAAAKHGTGWIMSGDANKHYEKGALTVYRDQILGECVAVYTPRQKP